MFDLAPTPLITHHAFEQYNIIGDSLFRSLFQALGSLGQAKKAGERGENVGETKTSEGWRGCKHFFNGPLPPNCSFASPGIAHLKDLKSRLDSPFGIMIKRSFQ